MYYNNDGLFILQENSFVKINTLLFCSYNIILLLFTQFELVIEHQKSKVFYFSRLHGHFNPSSLDLSLLVDPLL